MNEVFIIITCFYSSALVLVLFISFQIEAFLMRRIRKGGQGNQNRKKNSAELCSFSQFFKVLEK